MSKYYVDVRTRELVCKEDLDVNLAPELYYEYRCGTIEGIIVETWCCKNGQLINFATDIGNPYKNKERQLHFERHGVSPLYLKAYTVPPLFFKEEIMKVVQ